MNAWAAIVKVLSIGCGIVIAGAVVAGVVEATVSYRRDARKRAAAFNPRFGHLLVSLDRDGDTFTWRCRCTEDGVAANVDDALDAHWTHVDLALGVARGPREGVA